MEFGDLTPPGYDHRTPESALVIGNNGRLS
jgi:hypothetical protein